MWLSEFKVALVTKNTDKIGALISQMPQFKTPNEAEEAFYLFKQAKELLENLKDETVLNMKKVKDSIRYIESTNKSASAQFDILQ